MHTIILGIAESNTRRHFVGLWPNIEAVEASYKGAVRIEKLTADQVYECNDCTYGPKPNEYKAINMYVAELIDPTQYPDGTNFPHFQDAIQLYEINVLDLPHTVYTDED